MSTQQLFPPFEELNNFFFREREHWTALLRRHSRAGWECNWPHQARTSSAGSAQQSSPRKQQRRCMDLDSRVEKKAHLRCNRRRARFPALPRRRMRPAQRRGDPPHGRGSLIWIRRLQLIANRQRPRASLRCNARAHRTQRGRRAPPSMEAGTGRGRVGRRCSGRRNGGQWQRTGHLRVRVRPLFLPSPTANSGTGRSPGPRVGTHVCEPPGGGGEVLTLAARNFVFLFLFDIFIL